MQHHCLCCRLKSAPSRGGSPHGAAPPHGGAGLTRIRAGRAVHDSLDPDEDIGPIFASSAAGVMAPAPPHSSGWSAAARRPPCFMRATPSDSARGLRPEAPPRSPFAGDSLRGTATVVPPFWAPRRVQLEPGQYPHRGADGPALSDPPSVISGSEARPTHRHGGTATAVQYCWATGAEPFA